MFETIDNLTMVKGSTGDLSRMLRLDQLSGGRLPFHNGINPLVLDALQAGAAGWCTAGPCLRPQPRIDLYGAVRAGELPRAQAIYAELKPLLSSSGRAGWPPRRRPAWGCWAPALGIRVDPCHRLTTRAALR
jgi:4-hydroxy-tetrahydrodipicolinate synthase